MYDEKILTVFMCGRLQQGILQQERRMQYSGFNAVKFLFVGYMISDDDITW